MVDIGGSLVRAHDLPDDTLLLRGSFAVALTEIGYKISGATLSTMATRGGGPPFSKWGTRAVYHWGAGKRWAENKLTPPVESTSELRALNKPAGPSRAVDGSRPRPPRPSSIASSDLK
jgi:hypothetical protein